MDTQSAVSFASHPRTPVLPAHAPEAFTGFSIAFILPLERAIAHAKSPSLRLSRKLSRRSSPKKDLFGWAYRLWTRWRR